MSGAVLLIGLPANGIDLSTRFNATSRQIVFPPLGLMSLACSLRRADPTRALHCLDFNLCDYSGATTLEEYREVVVAEIRRYSQYSPAFFCISAMYSAAHEFLAMLAECLRLLHPEARIICGGAHASGVPQAILEQIPEIDLVVRGEGEEVLPALLAALEEGGDAALPGVWRRGGNGEGVDENIAQPVANCDLDFTLYAPGFAMERYIRETNSFNISATKSKARSFAVMASRGCPGRCIFCASAVTHGRRPRWRGLANIRDEILWLYEQYQVTRIYLMDDNFVPKAKALELFAMLAEITIPGFEVIIQNLSINHTDFELIDAMSVICGGYLPFAIESGVKEIQKKIRKYCDLDKAEQLVRYAQAKGNSVRCFYIIGFPDESIEDMRSTIQFAEHLDADWSTFNVAVPLPGTDMYSQFVDMGCIKNTARYWSAANIRERVFNTPVISAEEIRDMAYAANLRLNFLDNRLIRIQAYQKAEVVFQNFLAEVPSHLFGYESLRRIYHLTGEAEKEARTWRDMRELMATDRRARAFHKYLYLLDDTIRNELERAYTEAPTRDVNPSV